MTIFPTKCFSYQDARRLLDAINNAPFKSIVKFKYKTLITSRDVLNLLNEEFKANTESNIPFPSYRAEKDSVVFYFYGKVHFDIFKPVLEICEDLLDELDIIFDSIGEAAEFVGVDRSGIGACLRGAQKTSAGFHWERIFE